MDHCKGHSHCAKCWILASALALIVTTAQAIGVSQVSQPFQRPPPSQPTRHTSAGLQNYRDPTVEVAHIAQQEVAQQPATDFLGAVFTYDSAGNRQTAEYGNGVITTYTYNRRNRLTDLHTTYNGATLHRFHYTLDPSGLRTQVDATEADGTVRTTVYTYDVVKRLTGETQRIAGVVVFHATYGYDRVGNRTSATVNGAATTYVYDANNRLASEITVGGAASGTITYQYDAAGNRTGKSGPMGTVSYVYDDAGRMAEIRSAGEVVEYRYGS